VLRTARRGAGAGPDCWYHPPGGRASRRATAMKWRTRAGTGTTR